MKSKRIIIVAVVALLGVGAVFALRGRGNGDPAPAVVLQSLDGRQFTLQSNGKPTLLAFWAPWCPICKQSVETISRVARLSGSHAQVVSVAYSEDRAKVEQFTKDNSVDYLVLLGDDNAVKQYPLTGYPTFYVLGSDGRISRKVEGYVPAAGLLWELFWAG
jgi:thiol-disulfide isomerase/thioredoxin